MKVCINTMFPSNIHIASCAYCDTLIGFTNDEILQFHCDNHPRVLTAITCPECDGFLLLDDEEILDELV
mgnify:CR=1 FL=1